MKKHIMYVHIKTILFWVAMPCALYIVSSQGQTAITEGTQKIAIKKEAQPISILTQSLSFIEQLETSLPSSVFNTIFNSQDLSFIKNILNTLQRINWQKINKETPNYIALYTQFQAELDKIKKAHTEKVQKILQENEDALIVSKLIAPEELSKMIAAQDDDDDEVEIEPKSIEDFFKKQQEESLAYQKKQKDIKSEYYRKLLKTLPEYSKLDQIKQNIISYLSSRTDSSSIQDSLEKLETTFLIDQKLWRGLANAFIQIIFNAWSTSNNSSAEK